MENNNYTQTNQQAILSLIFGLAAILSACMGMIPILPTGFVCFPLSFIFGILALIYGIIALNQIRRRNEMGKPMAWTGIIIGGIIFLCALCMAVSLAALFIFAPEYVPTPPFPNGYQL